MYSRELKALVASYRSSFPWLFTALDRQRDGHKLTIEGVLPQDEPSEQQAKLGEVRRQGRGVCLGVLKGGSDMERLCCVACISCICSLAMQRLGGHGLEVA
jgi:hypothetical protein